MEGGWNSSMIYLVHCKNFCKCHNVSSPNITIKKKRKACSSCKNPTVKRFIIRCFAIVPSLFYQLQKISECLGCLPFTMKVSLKTLQRPYILNFNLSWEISQWYPKQCYLDDDLTIIINHTTIKESSIHISHCALWSWIQTLPWAVINSRMGNKNSHILFIIHIIVFIAVIY
jgi:hypothetical protein